MLCIVHAARVCVVELLALESGIESIIVPA